MTSEERSEVIQAWAEVGCALGVFDLDPETAKEELKRAHQRLERLHSPEGIYSTGREFMRQLLLSGWSAEHVREAVSCLRGPPDGPEHPHEDVILELLDCLGPWAPKGHGLVDATGKAIHE